MSAQNSEHRHVQIDFWDVLRFVIELFAFVSLCVWGFIAWPFPWNIVVGIGAPALAIVLWALFRSPKAVIHVDAFGKAIVEIIVMTAAAFAWWDLGQPIVAVIFAIVALVSGIISGRKELS
ncbi:YrdB family protein [Planctomonas sp. JC2975]|uniref:YrdB family protein n=1 Tax=Planctomonas sp. JC2975 TaxID=2729626 RepID=UPI0014742343|nr:YrdB family protein [Planctomonas sp. JC2975]NNC11725.1 YrdB family protein [Planctomonas sp. JC2975]